MTRSAEKDLFSVFFVFFSVFSFLFFCFFFKFFFSVLREARKKMIFYFARSAEKIFEFAGRSPPKKKTFQICREITAQKTRTVLIVLQTQEEGIPDNRGTSEPIAVLFVLQTQRGGGPGQSGGIGAYSSTICTTDTGGGR